MSEPKILVLGGAGMLGHKMFQILRERFPGTLCTTRRAAGSPEISRFDWLWKGAAIPDVDVMKPVELEGKLREIRPDFIVNCVGVIKQRREAHLAIPSITVNSLLPHQLAAMAVNWGGRVIHFSTDCVFSGKRGQYTEDDPSDAEDLYGKSKYLGEVAVSNALTLRTSIIGRELSEHQSLLDWFLSQNHRKVRGFTRVIYSGVTTNHLSEVVANLIQDFPNLAGLFQVASSPIPKYGLLCLIRDTYGLDIEIEPDEKEISDRSMTAEKFHRATGYTCPPWPLLVQRLAEDRTPYPNLP